MAVVDRCGHGHLVEYWCWPRAPQPRHAAQVKRIVSTGIYKGSEVLPGKQPQDSCKGLHLKPGPAYSIQLTDAVP